MSVRSKAAALLPHSKTWRKNSIPDHQIDNSKETGTIREKHPTRSPYLPPCRGELSRLFQCRVGHDLELPAHPRFRWIDLTHQDSNKPLLRIHPK